MELAIQTEHLTKIYANRLIAVNDMSLEVPKGAVFGLLGPNGAGKTTHLAAPLGIAATHRRQGPRVGGKLCGFNAVGVRQAIGYLPTNPEVAGHTFGRSSTSIFSDNSAASPREVRKPRLVSLIRAVGLLDDATSQRIGTFSTGMNTRLGDRRFPGRRPALVDLGRADGRTRPRRATVHARPDPRPG